MRRFLAAFLCVYLLFAGQTSVRAQSQSTSRLGLYALQTGSFPSITAGLDVFDSTGSVVTGLKPDAITLLEDNQPRPINQLQEVLSGVEFALALDPGPAFAFQDASAVNRYSKIVQIIKDWVATHSDTLGDDLSLIPTYGNLSAHLATTAAFSSALDAFQPNLPFITPT
ncbi:MAG: hypothetical protein ACXWNC_09715, partial [Anaerolineales bacterium]